MHSKIRKLLAYSYIACTLAIPGSAFAISEEKCLKESECVRCKSELKCQKCMHNCYNKWGGADEDRFHDKYEVAKQCIADCWDPPKK